MSYWGENDTSISFCENKYSEIYWIAEYYNTCSSFLYILAALPFLRGRIKKIGWSCVGVGVGSMMLHGSMRYYGQWVDENTNPNPTSKRGIARLAAVKSWRKYCKNTN